MINQRQIPHQIQEFLDVETDCRKLEQSMISNKWDLADNLTEQIMLKTSGIKPWNKGEMNAPDFKTFPLDQLKRIDNLWTKYSQGKFGFTVQYRIYFQICAEQEAIRIEREKNNDFRLIEQPQIIKCTKFALRIGWQWKYQDSRNGRRQITFNLNNSPPGNLPIKAWTNGKYKPVQVFHAFMYRISQLT